MKRTSFVTTGLALCSALLIPAISQAASVSCTRAGLQEAVDLYVAAQTKGDTSGLPLANGLGYWENNAPATRRRVYQQGDEDRSPAQPARHRQLPDVHRSDRTR